MIEGIAVREKKVGLDAADDSSDTSGAQPVLPQAFDPEQSTSAIIVHHPAAKYFVV